MYISLITIAQASAAPSTFDWIAFWAAVFTCVSALAAAVSAWASWRSVRQQSESERPLLVPTFSMTSGGSSSTVKITNVGKRTAVYVLVLVATRNTYRWGQLSDAIQPNQTIKATATTLELDIGDIPVARVVVSCIDSLEKRQLAWSMDGKVNFAPRRHSQWLDGLDGIKEIFETLYPDERLDGKVLVD